MNLDIAYILSSSSAERVPLKINPALSQKFTIYNLMEITRLPSLPILPTIPPREQTSYSVLGYNNRLATYTPNWKLSNITAEEMARAGFHYIGPGDRVKCLYCTVELDQWKLKNDPVGEHKLLSPGCNFFVEHPGYDVCGPYNPVIPLSSLNGDTVAQKIKRFLDSVAVDVAGPFRGNRPMASVESRVKSFRKMLNKPDQVVIRNFCKAGFVYIGDCENDLMTCYCCYQSLQGWGPNDDPWVEHALWSPHCRYLLLKKGKQFVVETFTQNGRDVNDFVRQESSDPIILNNDPSVENNAANSVKRDADNSGVEMDCEHERSVAAVCDQLENVQLCEREYDQCGLTGIPPPPTILGIPKEHAESNDMLCKICLKEKIETVAIPCGHAAACVQCAVTLDHCAMCRFPIDKVMAVFPYFVQDNENYPNRLECLAPKPDKAPVDPMRCKICCVEQMTTAFLPCRHICACFECATMMEECPVCVEPYFAILQVFL